MPYQTKPFTFQQWLEQLLTYIISHMERWKHRLVAQAMPATTSPVGEQEIAVPQELQGTITQQQAVEQAVQASSDWQILQVEEEEPQIVHAVADIQPRAAYIPGNIRDIPLLNTNKELVAQYLEQHRSTAPAGDSNDPITYLMGLADRFHCTMEMATFLAIMSIGRPQRLLRKDAEWDATTRQAVHQLHSALQKSCTDDLELALKLYAAWSLEPQEEYIFIQPSALAHTWHQRRVPALSTEMHNALNTRMNTFLQAVLQATTFAQIRALVELYEIKESADHWLQETEKVFFSARQEAWASTFFINYGLIRSKVEPERERLLRVLEINKKTFERRPLQFDLLHKIRLLFAFAKAQRKDIPSYQIRIDSDIERRFHQTLPSYIELARFLAEKTRTNQETLIPTFTTPRLFLDQAIPVGSRYLCRVTTAPPHGKALVQLSERIADPPGIEERFRTFTYTNAKNSTAAPILQARSTQRALTPATPMIPAVPYTPLYRANTIAGLLDMSTTACTSGDMLEVAVTDYLLDEFSHPYVIVALPPELSRFELFCQRYQVGDSPDVTVYGYEDYTSDPAHPHVALLVREQVSLLEITVEPEHISFFDLGETIKEIPVGTTLRLPINDIDREREVVTFSSLSLVELHLNIQLNKRSAGLAQENGSYEFDAIIRGEVHNETLQLELPWHAPTAESGLVYIIPTSFHANELALYQLGDKAKVRLSFPERSSSNLLLQFPHEVSQAIDLQTGTQRLFWEQNRLHFPERMPYATYYYFSTLSSDPAYQQALLHLYRATHQFTLEVIALNPTTNLLAVAGAEADPAEDLLEELLQTNRSGLSSTLDHAPDRREESLLSYYETETRALGRVTSVKDFGAFVEIEPGVEGLIHKSKMWGYVTDARNVLQPDDQVEVLILGLNDAGDKLELSMHIPELNPLLDYQEGDTVHGTITNVQDFGAFVDIAPGVSGFVPKSKMWGFVPDAREIVHVGQWITAYVLEVSLKKSSLTLSMEVAENDPLNDYEAGQTVRGKITGIRHYGAFVAFDRSIKGLIHSHYISPNLVDARRSHLKVGDEVTVLIVRVNWEERNLELSLTDAY